MRAGFFLIRILHLFCEIQRYIGCAKASLQHGLGTEFEIYGMSKSASVRPSLEFSLNTGFRNPEVLRYA